MHKKIIISSISLITLLLIFLILSIYFPSKFIINNSENVNLELKQFSIISPTYTLISNSNDNQKKAISIIKLHRNKFLFWDYNPNENQNIFVLNNDYVNFKKKYDSNKLNQVDKIIAENPEAFIDPYEIKENDTQEEIFVKRMYSAPPRNNSENFNLDKFKELKRGMKYTDFALKIGTEDLGIPPDEFYSQGDRQIFNISSPKVSFVFLTYKEGSPSINLDSVNFPLYDIGIVTQRKEKIIVPVNPDNTFNWEAIKDKID